MVKDLGVCQLSPICDLVVVELDVVKTGEELVFLPLSHQACQSLPHQLLQYLQIALQPSQDHTHIITQLCPRSGHQAHRQAKIMCYYSHVLFKHRW